MSKSNVFEADFLKLTFQAVAIANIADNAAASPLTNLYVSLHTSDPGEAGDQSTSETTYTGYARVAVARSTAGWAITGSSISPVDDITFGQCTGGTATITHFAIGTLPTTAGKVLYSGTVSPSISIAVGVTPVLTVASTITED